MKRLTQTFTAWRIVDGKNHPIALPITDDLSEVINAAMGDCQKGDTFAIRATDGLTGSQRVEFYQVRQRSQASYVRKPGFAHAVAVKPLYADLLFWSVVKAFEPLESWRWTPGADVVGADPRADVTVEARA